MPDGPIDRVVQADMKTIGIRRKGSRIQLWDIGEGPVLRGGDRLTGAIARRLLIRLCRPLPGQDKIGLPRTV